MSDDPPPPVPSRPSRRRLVLILLGAGLALAVLVCFASVALLDSAWLHDQLVAKASAALKADLQVADIQFAPLRGAATLRGIDLERHTGDSDLTVRVDRADVEVCIFCLVVR
ncbi:MAG TPA: hypothetical protein P5572_21540, partial [Phycisphaerae bacterium]|nr:hypothetical protein [Phycisphaerae bacterium]